MADRIAIIFEYQTRRSKILGKRIPDEQRDLLRIYLEHYGIEPKSIYFTFAYPVEVTKVDKVTAALHQERLIKELQAQGVTKVLTCGVISYQILSGDSSYYNIANLFGRAFMVENMYCVAAPSINNMFFSATKPNKLGDVERIRDFNTCMEKLVKNNQPMPLPDYSLTIIKDISELIDSLAEMATQKILVCDTETTGLNPLEDTLLCIGLGYFYPGKNIRDPKCGRFFVIPKELLYQEETIKFLRDFFSGKTCLSKFVFHNAKFDLKFLISYLGISFKAENVEDTILLSYILDERPIGYYGKSAHGLKTQARVYFDAEDYALDWDEFYATPEEERNYVGLWSYLSLDLVYTRALYDILQAKINEEDQDLYRPYYTLLIPATCALSEIELKGALVNVDYLETLRIEYTKFVENGQLELQSIVGDPHFNANSPKQVKEAIENLSLGKITLNSTRREILEVLAQMETNDDSLEDEMVSSFCQKLLDFREYSKTLSTFINGLLTRADKNGRVHTDFNVNGTVNGRLSSSNPNLHNIPFDMGPVIRKSFKAAPGYTFGTFDFSQLELRVGAWISHDEYFLSLFKTNQDIHRQFASKIFGIPYDEVTKLQRKHGKTLVFSMIYGKGPKRLAHELGITIQQAKDLVQSLLGSFPGFTKWADGIRQQIDSQQFVKSPMGRKRRWPLIVDQNKNKVMREAVNGPIQSMASDICLTSLIDLHEKLKPYDSYITFAVHDSLEFEIKNEHLETVIAIIRENMTNTFSNADIEFVVDAEIGENWAEAQKVE